MFLRFMEEPGLPFGGPIEAAANTAAARYFHTSPVNAFGLRKTKERLPLAFTCLERQVGTGW